MVLGIFNWIGKEINQKLPYFYYFLYGCIAGVIIFVIVGVTLLIIGKSKKVLKKINEKDVAINPEYKDIINEQIKYYDDNCKGMEAKAKIDGLSKIFNNMLTQISTLYYPNSSDPIFEINIDQLVDLTGYIIHRINFTLDRLLEGKLKIVNKFAKGSIKDVRFSSLIKQKQVEEETEIVKKKSKFSDFIASKAKKIGTKIGLNLADKEIDLLINDIGEDINKLYSGQVLIFSDLTKKQAKKANKIKLDDLIENDEED